ncbi:MAG: cysteine hydrolase family protein [Acetivibrionales bacterium]|jgi:nicotinamidase-related amidase|nr:cysteine hydrolase [Clostridiaceae bacterium]
MKNNKNEFLKKSNETLEKIFDLLAGLPAVKVKDLQPENTAFIIVDMINGFVREGALASNRAEMAIPAIEKLSKLCDKNQIAKLAFADSHTNASPEFGAYPEHCLAGTSESEVVDELKEIGGYTLIPKNSTNGFHEEEFQKWLKDNQKIDTFIVTGVCTNICVEQFALTIKTFFNKQNKKSRVIVPINAVETYDLGIHDGDLMNVMALYNMIVNGIEVTPEVE